MANTPSQDATIITTAFLDERDALYEVCNDALNLMSFMDSYWAAQKDHGDRSVLTVVARGKMFAALKVVRQKHLRKRILEIQDRLHQRERELKKQLAGKGE